MPKQIPADELEAITGAVTGYPDGVGAEGIRGIS
jgi:hypothetical protein